MTHIFKPTLTLSLMAAAVMTACGGGGGGTATPTTTPVATVSLAGVVADGYLTGAKVCLDKNENMVCDAGEPSATTGAGGAYTISGVTAADVAAFPVVAEVPATATDSDFPGSTVGKAFVLTAPKGNSTVTPLSSLVHQELQAAPALSAASAAANVKTALGITTDPLADYIAKPDASAHIRAQMITQSLKNNADAIGGGTAAQKKDLQGVLLTMAKQAVPAAAPASSASAPASVPVVGVEDFNTVSATLANKQTTGTASQAVTVNFDAVNGATSIKACDALTLTNLKRWDQTPLTAATPAAATLLANPTVTQTTSGKFVDLRFYISNVLLWDAAGNAVPLVLTEDASQSKNVALLDFGYNTAATGTPVCSTAYKTAITGKVVPGTYTGISFTVGVPVRSADLSTKLNHGNAADTASPAPLQNLAMNWSWQSGRKFFKVDFQPDTAAKKFAAGAVGSTAVVNTHIGSTGCVGNPATVAGTETACTNANRLGVKFDGFKTASNTVLLDVAKLFKNSDLTYEGGGAGGCMSGTTDPECAPIFKAFGLGLTGANAGRTLSGADVQTIFSVK
ncbi:MbnP family copper-binding protein [Rhodoferax sp.]|uniref:MbnP family copper-binding protein n=1 Tax=Rhodoferax sp. TaxID=50421 RepID=UPI00262DB0BB|nr:MbnP family copper-binding protein [Rhodoferax sp.]MDD2810961.1 metallo-mystery pair system four-Cys motif protein [Rhodoferax sp.]MDD4942410.1 metallo-mystery pair system four-Cys motif protein [Rhodoferax sp.]MDD5479564.1 metallo-mystery pair system four-Cys motif protein [Rhodoferax sp.]